MNQVFMGACFVSDFGYILNLIIDLVRLVEVHVELFTRLVSPWHLSVLPCLIGKFHIILFGFHCGHLP